jgi:SecD/SecF fusion protein
MGPVEMEDSDQSHVDQERASVGSSRAPIIALGMLSAFVLAGAGLFVRSQTTPGTRLVYDINEKSGSAEDVVIPLQRRLNGLDDARVKVQALGTRQIEIVIGSRDRAIIDSLKKLVESAGVMRFMILANPWDHQSLIESVTNQANSNSRDSNSRDVLNQDGSIVGRWVTVAREDEANGDSSRPFRVNVSYAMVRDGETGVLIALPAEVRGEDGESTIAKWIDEEGIKSLDVLMSIDPKLEVGGTDLAFAASTFDKNGAPAVAFTLTDRGSGRFFALTTNNAPVGSWQRQLGIVLDDNLLSAPSILQPIRKWGRITGRFTRAEVDWIVRLLKAGQLPVALRKEVTSETLVEIPNRLANWF